MDNEVPLVKDKTDIITLISQYLPLKKSGRNYKGLCPFHSEKTPSFMVSPDLQIFKCFGCGRGGSVFDFLMEQEGLDFREALEELARRAGVKLTRQKKEEKSPEENRRERVLAANALAAKFYNFLLTNHPAGRMALEYITQRGLTPATIKKFNLGYAPNRNDLLVRFLQKKGFSTAEILESGLGLLSEKSGGYYDRFRGRIVFPLFDERSRVVGFSGRALSPDPDVPKYLNSPETPVFHKSRFLYGLNFAKGEIRKSARTLLVEGQMDLISNVQAGVENVVATSGSSFTPEQARQLKKLAGEVIFCFDNDAAGRTALVRAVAIAEGEGLAPLVSVLPEGVKDPDEAAQKRKAEWLKNLETPRSFYDDFLDQETRGILLSDGLGKRRAVEKILPVLGRITDPLQKAHFAKQLSQRLDLEERFVSEALEKISKELSRDGKRFSGLGDPRPGLNPILASAGWESLKGGKRLEMLRKYFLALLLRFDFSVTAPILPKVKDDFFPEPDFSFLLPRLKKIAAQSKKKLRFDLLRKDLPPGTAGLLSELLLLDLGNLETEVNLQTGEIKVAFKELQRESLRSSAAATLSEIKQKEGEGNRKDLENLQKSLNRIYQKLKALD